MTVCYSGQSWLVVAVFSQEDRLLPDDDLAAGGFRPSARGLLGGFYRLVSQLQEDHKDHEKDPGHEGKARPAGAAPPRTSGRFFDLFGGFDLFRRVLIYSGRF